MNISCVNPGLVVGKILTTNSHEVRDMFQALFKSPIYLNLNFKLVHIDDVSEAHL